MSIDSIIQENSIPSPIPQQKNALGKDDFLKLMMIQMQHQDQLNPMDNEQMLSQMAQFSSLEQMSNLNDNFANAASSTAFVDATRLLGKQVSIPDISGSSQLISSTVKTIRNTTQGPLLTLENGQVITVDQVLQVEEIQQ